MLAHYLGAIHVVGFPLLEHAGLHHVHDAGIFSGNNAGIFSENDAGILSGNDAGILSGNNAGIFSGGSYLEQVVGLPLLEHARSHHVHLILPARRPQQHIPRPLGIL